MLWKIRNHTFDLSKRALLMGVLNVTPDSFSDGGRWADPGPAVEAALLLAAEGADLLDVGGESSRPGAAPVDEAEELRRVLPVIGALAERCPLPISVDTCKPGVARAAIAHGASVVNDIGGLRDAHMRRVVRESGAGAIAMHMQGTPATMQRAPVYADVVAEVRAFLAESLRLCVQEGIPAENLLLDPGIGFGKTLEHNLALLRGLEVLAEAGRPVAIGVSRKSFLAALTGRAGMTERSWPTVALTSYLRSCGAALIRVHEVRANAEALRMTEAILEGGRPC